MERVAVGGFSKGMSERVCSWVEPVSRERV